MQFLQEIYLANKVEINMLLVAVGVAFLDVLIEKSKLKSNSVLTALFNGIKSILTKKK